MAVLPHICALLWWLCQFCVVTHRFSDFYQLFWLNMESIVQSYRNSPEVSLNLCVRARVCLCSAVVDV